MSDIVERLRNQFCDLGESDYTEAADEIERLRAELAAINRLEPIGFIIDEDSYGPAAHFPFGFPPRGTKLYTQPVVAEIAIKGQEPVGILLNREGKVRWNQSIGLRIGAALYAQPVASVADKDAEYAAMYRWLRDNKHLDAWWSVDGPKDRCENIDEDIRAAMAKGE